MRPKIGARRTREDGRRSRLRPRERPLAPGPARHRQHRDCRHREGRQHREGRRHRERRRRTPRPGRRLVLLPQRVHARPNSRARAWRARRPQAAERTTPLEGLSVRASSPKRRNQEPDPAGARNSASVSNAGVCAERRGCQVIDGDATPPGRCVRTLTVGPRSRFEGRGLGSGRNPGLVSVLVAWGVAHWHQVPESYPSCAGPFGGSAKHYPHP